MYFCRLWVHNDGKHRAEDVQVYAESLWRRKNGSDQEVSSFLPMNLRWSHGNPAEPEVFAKRINPKMGKYCDLGYVAEPTILRNEGVRLIRTNEVLFGIQSKTNLFHMETEVYPNNKSNILEPGRYKLRLKIAAGNADPVEKSIAFEVSEDWSYLPVTISAAQ